MGFRATKQHQLRAPRGACGARTLSQAPQQPRCAKHVVLEARGWAWGPLAADTRER